MPTTAEAVAGVAATAAGLGTHPSYHRRNQTAAGGAVSSLAATLAGGGGGGGASSSAPGVAAVGGAGGGGVGLGPGGGAPERPSFGAHMRSQTFAARGTPTRSPVKVRVGEEGGRFRVEGEGSVYGVVAL